MRSKSKRTKKKNGIVKKVVLLIVLAIILLLASLAIFYPDVIKKITHTEESSFKIYRGGSGGDVSSVTKYHDKAVAAWETGDKAGAKSFAKKGLEENEKLTLEQQQQVPDQGRKVFEMFDITIGKYKGG